MSSANSLQSSGAQVHSAQHDEAEDARDLGALPGVPHRGPDWREGLRRQGIRPIGVRRSPLSTLAAAAPIAEASPAAAAPTAEASADAAAFAFASGKGMQPRRDSQSWNLR